MPCESPRSLLIRAQTRSLTLAPPPRLRYGAEAPTDLSADKFIPQPGFARKKRRAAEFARKSRGGDQTCPQCLRAFRYLWVGIFSDCGGAPGIGFSLRLDQYDLTGLDVAQLLARFFFDCAGIFPLQAVDLVLELLV